jgi:CHAT domain-containing protein
MRQLLLAGLVAILVGCQSGPPPAPPALSLDEAKKVSAAFATVMVAPPRKIDDITAILDQQKPDESYRTAVNTKLRLTPPSAANNKTLSDFYGEQADISMEAGLSAQALEKARESVRLAREANDREALTRALGRLLAVEAYLGHDTLDTAQEQLRTSTSDGWSIMALTTLTQASLRQADLEGAKGWVSRSDAIFARYKLQQRAPSTIADVRANVTNSHASLEASIGHYAEAERYIRSSVEDVRLWRDPSATASGAATNSGAERADFRLSVRTRFLVNLLVTQGRLPEAEEVARESLIYNLRRTGRTSPTTANSIGTLAYVLASQGRFIDAERLSLAEIETREALGIPTMEAGNRLGDLLAVQGRGSEAKAKYQGTYESLPHVMALYDVGDAADGLALAQRIGDHRSRMLGEDSYQAAFARGFIAAGLALQGNDSAAADVFRLAFEASRPTDTPMIQVQRRYVAEAHLRLLAKPDNPPSDSVAQAFRVADALRAAGTDRAVSASLVRAHLPDSELAELARREQDARREVSARQEILANALSQIAEEQNGAAVASLRADIEKLKQAQATLAQELEHRYPEYARLMNPPPASVEQARAALTGGEALVALYVGQRESYVWALRKEGPVAFAKVPLTLEQLARKVEQLRRALDPNVAALGEIPPFDVALGHEFYAVLLKPVESGWKGAKRLIVVPSGPLAQVPFSLLVTQAVAQPKHERGALFSEYQQIPFLAREVAITQVPSVAVLVSLRSLAPTTATRKPFVGFGDPWFSVGQAQAAELGKVAVADTRGFKVRASPETQRLATARLDALPRLPDTALEVTEIAQTLHADMKTDVYLGPAANEWQVRSMKLDDRRVVMFATHGLQVGDLDGLDQPALALSAPSVAKVDGDGLLTVEKILGLTLNADWVVLSACNTAAGDGAGAEAVSGLGRAFFYAGARALLVTNWPVETTSARKLTTTLFQKQAQDPQLSRAEALRQSMLSLLDGPGATDAAGKTLYTYAHPIFWAPYSIVGDGQ